MGSLRDLVYNPSSKKNTKQENRKHHSWQSVLANRLKREIRLKYGTSYDIYYQEYKNSSGSIHVEWFKPDDFEDVKTLAKQVIKNFLLEKESIYGHLKLDVLDISFIYEDNQRCFIIA
jgi:hypothetical protein